MVSAYNIYKYISVLSQGTLLYATRMLRVDFKVSFLKTLEIQHVMFLCITRGRDHEEWVFYKIPLNSHSEIKKSSPSNGCLFVCFFPAL